MNHGVAINTQDKDGRKPLRIAVHAPDDPYAGNTDIVEMVDFLLKSGADETIVDNEGKAATQKLDGGILRPDLFPSTKVGEEDVDLARHQREPTRDGVAVLFWSCASDAIAGVGAIPGRYRGERQRLGSCGCMGAARGIGSGEGRAISDDRGIPVKPVSYYLGGALLEA